MPDERVVKVPMRLELIRRMDRALSEGRGGFTTRADFILEAVEQLLVELSYEEAPPEPTARYGDGETVPSDQSPTHWEHRRAAATRLHPEPASARHEPVESQQSPGRVYDLA